MAEKCFSQMLKWKKKTNFSVDKEPLDSSRIEQRDVKNMTTNESISSKKQISKLRLLQWWLSFWQYKQFYSIHLY